MELEAALFEMPVLDIGKLFTPPTPVGCFRDDCTLSLSLETTYGGLSYADGHKLRLSVKCIIWGAFVA